MEQRNCSKSFWTKAGLCHCWSWARRLIKSALWIANLAVVKSVRRELLTTLLQSRN